MKYTHETIQMQSNLPHITISNQSEVVSQCSKTILWALATNDRPGDAFRVGSRHLVAELVVHAEVGQQAQQPVDKNEIRRRPSERRLRVVQEGRRRRRLRRRRPLPQRRRHLRNVHRRLFRLLQLPGGNNLSVCQFSRMEFCTELLSSKHSLLSSFLWACFRRLVLSMVYAYNLDLDLIRLGK